MVAQSDWGGGHIAPGIVDERSIADVRPDELVGYTQCHFFAGIGIWSYALRLAGWPDDRPVWTGSCPCQPFSGAGKGDGFADERHLWPHWQWLIQQRKPVSLFGEQVASKDADAWLDLVQADLEGMGYAFGCVPFPSAGIGAPHLRDRTYWLANANANANANGHGCGQGRQRIAQAGDDGFERDRALVRMANTRMPGHSDPEGRLCGEGAAGRRQHKSGQTLRCGDSVWLGDSISEGLERHGRHGDDSSEPGRERTQPAGPAPEAGGVGGVADAERIECEAGSGGHHSEAGSIVENRSDADGCSSSNDGAPGPTNGFWRDADWLFCRDKKFRAVEPGTFPLAYGSPARVGRLRAYGNGLNAEAAAQFIMAAKDIL